MFQKLIKKTNLDVEERTFSVCYYETPRMNGASRYSAEVVFHPRDHMILDADSVKGLETKLACLVVRRSMAACWSKPARRRRDRNDRQSPVGDRAQRAQIHAATDWGHHRGEAPAGSRPRRDRTRSTGAERRP